MSNAARIVSTLDGLLTREASLIIYGRASIALGFENPPEATLRSLDVDAILTASYESAFAESPEFWDAQGEVNRLLARDGLYMTHIFPADMVFLRRQWETEIVPVLRPPLKYLRACPESGLVARFRRGGDPTKPIPTGIPGNRPSTKWPEKDFPDALSRVSPCRILNCQFPGLCPPSI